MPKIIKNIILLLLIVTVHFYFYNSTYLKTMDYKVYDVMMSLSNEIAPHDENFYTVIVDIDEKSIQALGQWPWSRVITANIINKINALNPSALGVNILFPEVDRVSPVNIQNFYKNFFNLEVKFQNIPSSFKDNDKLLLESVLTANATLSTYFYDSISTLNHCEETRYKKNIFEKREKILTLNSFLCNHQTLQKGVENFGFLNASQDSDGIFRRIPLLVDYQDKIFPSFALATLLSFDDSIEIQNKEETILLNFSSKKPKRFSAIDILNGTVSMEDIQGKIVVLGTSLVGVTPRYKISTGEKISNAMIQAITIDNILNNNFLKQPTTYQKVNILLSFMLILYFMYLFNTRHYAPIIIIFGLLGIVSFTWTLSFYLEGVYVSIVYLWLPFVLLFIVLIVEHIHELNQEKIAQEKLFIRQSKLASMGEMIALIAHQWRQPLSAINGTVLNMDIDNRKKILDEKKLNHYLDDIEQTTAYLSKTINDFTDFFSKDKEAHLFSLEKVINQAKNLAVKRIEFNIEIVCVNNEKIEIKGYASELVQSLLVLLNNALYVCENNLESEKEGRIFIYVSKIGKDILISVEDNGGGVPKKEMKKIFNPYYTTKDKQHGTGLGLYILKLIVEDSMNGKISLHNTQEGAVFTIKIPQSID